MKKQEHNPLDLNSAAKRQEYQHRKAEIARHERVADLRKLMSEPWGRRFAYRTIEESGTFSPTFSTNAMQMAFNEGYRAQGSNLLALIIAECPGQFPAMMAENQKLSNDDSTES